MPVYADPIDGLAVPAGLLQAWTAGLVERLGTPPDIAADVAEVLVASDRRGIASHGTARLPNYVALIEAGVMDPAARPVPSTAAGRRCRASTPATAGATTPAGSRSTPRSRRRATLGTAIVRRAQHQPLRDRRLVRAAGGRRRA